MMKLRALPFLFLPLLASAATAQTDYTALQKRWAEVKYQLPEAEREAAFETLVDEARHVAEAHPDSPETWIWEGIILASYAGEKGGLGALKLVKEARRSLEHALELNAAALDGSAYTSLGSLYYQVPGWPVGFGNDDKAREMLGKAVSMNPDGIDPNYFLGDFLLSEGEYAAAVAAFEKALAAPARPERPVADAGRREEVRAGLTLAQAKLEQQRP